MRLTIESTSIIQSIDGVPCRIWEGVTDQGTPVKAWVRAVQPQTHDAEKLVVFDAELKALPRPVPGPGAIDLRFII